MFDIAAIGDVVIDFTPAGMSQRGNKLFEQHPGGAPANMLVAATKNNFKGALITKVGNDPLGVFLSKVLEKQEIETKGVNYSSKLPTLTAWVDIDEHGERSFFSIQTEFALSDLSIGDIDYEMIDDCRLLHIAGSVLAWDKPLKAVKAALEYARKNNKLVSCDMNWRPVLCTKEEAIQRMVPLVKQCDILKLSTEEFELCTGTTDLEKGSKELIDQGIKLVAVTMGAKGSYYRFVNGAGRLYTYDTKVIDTNASGDSFMGYMLSGLLQLNKSINGIMNDEMYDIMDRANAAGAMCASKSGAVDAIPTPNDVEACIKTIPKLILD